MPDLVESSPINIQEVLFERMPMGLVVFDRQMRVVRCNPTWVDFIDRYTPSNASDVMPGKSLAELAPGAEQFFLPAVERVLKGETVYINAMRSVSGGIESFWDVTFSPVYKDSKIVGILDVTTDATERVLAQQRLEQRVEERTREVERRRELAESMRDIVRMINSNMPLETFLGKAVELAVQQMAAEASILQELDLENKQLIYIASYRMPLNFPRGYKRSFDAINTPGMAEYLNIIAEGKPTYGNYPPLPERVEEIENDGTTPPEFKNHRLAVRKAFAGSLAVPLMVQNSVYGAMVFYYVEPQEFTEEQVQLAMAFADQVSLAIENARLRLQAEQNAVLAERGRLARDLHDAVTQTLFTASLISDVLPRLWERNPQLGALKLDELRSLTRGALSEMRTLLIELRPDTFSEVDVGDLCQHLINAFAGRTGIAVKFSQEIQSPLPLEIKEVFYRVAQEALNNIAKHAQATEVSIHLCVKDNWAKVQIQDNGVGFDAADLSAENLGLRIMRERVEEIQAQLVLESIPGKGTRISICWQAEQEEA